MDPKINKMSADSPCDCESGKVWKQCCGQHLENPNGYMGRVQLLPGLPTRWFLADATATRMHCDEEGRPIVFSSRAQAIGLAEKLGSTTSILGMSEEKWVLFQRDFPNLVEIGNAVA